MLQTENFHSHTWRCGHADGTEREYVEAAVEKGIKKLGFSDHAPYVFEGDYYSNFRIKHCDIDSYFETLLALKEEFKDKIELHIGFEAEYYPKYFDGFLKLISKYPVEYLILGQHFPGNEIGEAGNGRETQDPERLKRYVSQVTEGMETGYYNCVAHPDLIWFTGDSEIYKSEMRRLCENAKRLNVPIEINLLGMRTGRNYPDERLWKIAGEVGNIVVCGSDAHAPQDVQDQASYDVALSWAEKYHLDLRPASYILNGGYLTK